MRLFCARNPEGKLQHVTVHHKESEAKSKAVWHMLGPVAAMYEEDKLWENMEKGQGWRVVPCALSEEKKGWEGKTANQITERIYEMQGSSSYDVVQDALEALALWITETPTKNEGNGGGE